MKQAWLWFMQSWRYGLLLFIGYGLAFTNGFRMPSLWSINYFLPSIFEGFYRRSLLGTLLFPLGEWRFQYYSIASIQISVFLLLNAAILYKVWHANAAMRWLYLLFLVSPAGGYFFHEIGYVDQVLYLVLLWALNTHSILLVRILLILSLFVHEMALFTTVPLYLAISVIRGQQRRDLIVTASLCLFSFSCIYAFLQTSSEAAISQFLALAKQWANYPLRTDYFDYVYRKSFAGALYQIPYIAREIFNFIILMPLCLLVAWIFALSAKTSAEKRYFFGVGFIASFSPLLLGAFGFDYSRWIFLCIASSCIALYAVRENMGWKSPVLLSIFFLILPTVGFLDYFDNYTPRFAPWYQWRYFYAVDLWKILYSIPTR